MEDEKKEIPSSEIIEKFILEDFTNDFMSTYGMNLAISDKHPEQANNEVRNAFVHLSRAVSHPDERKHEISKAKAHIERGKRDCLKLSIIRKAEDLRSDIYNIEIIERTSLAKYKDRMKKFSSERTRLYQEETKGNAISEGLAQLLLDMLQLEDELHHNYHKPNKFSGLIRRWMSRIFRWAANTLAAILLGLVSAYIFAVMFPDKDVSKTAKEYIQKLEQAINGNQP